MGEKERARSLRCVDCWVCNRVMNPDDYDEDGNNIVPCPICLSRYCPAEEGGKCPDEDEFVASMNEKLKICPNGYHKNGDPKCTCGTKIANPDLLK